VSISERRREPILSRDRHPGRPQPAPPPGRRKHSRELYQATLARKLGAHLYIDSGATNAAEELQKLGGARVILTTAPESPDPRPEEHPAG
jgi:hypothetical protein